MESDSWSNNTAIENYVKEMEAENKRKNEQMVIKKTIIEYRNVIVHART